MAWQIDWGHVAALHEARRRKGKKVPTGFLRRPKIRDSLYFVFASFWELSTERQVGIGLGPIPWRAVRDYANDYDISGDAFDRFLLLIRVLDGEYLRLMNPKPTK